MASINKLAIRGVRSFSPDDEEQVISFCFPLTIIVGENGCGKTTIIESLKYAVTGSLPPGNKSGQSFVHDPKSVGQSTVKGQIKLRFTNRAGKSMVVIRSMEVTQKKTTMSFKALDGILRTTHPESGERVSLSHKCSELDRQIPALLGVSKAILDHVIFCHQEESSWPLMDGATLKKRFDDIFDSTRYTKALEQITKTRKGLVSTSKDHKADLNSLASHKHAASLTREELEQNLEKMDIITKDIESYDEQIEHQMKHLEELEESEQKLEEAREQIQHQESLIQEQELVAQSIQELLENDFTEKHDESQLKKMMYSLDNQGDRIQEDLLEKDNQCKEIKKAIEELTNDLIERKTLKAKLESDKEAHDDNVQNRLHLLQSISQEYDIPIPHASRSHSAANSSGTVAISSQTSPDTQKLKSLSKEQIDSFIESLNQKQNDLNTKLDTMRSLHQKKDDEIQSQIAVLETKYQTVNINLKRFQSEESKMEQELQYLNSLGSSRSRIHRSDVEAARATAEQSENDYKDLSNHPKLTTIPRKLKECEEKVQRLTQIIEEDNSTLLELRRFSQDQNNIQMLKQQVQHELERLEEACFDNSTLMERYHTSADLKDMSSFKTLMDTVRNKYDACKRDLEKVNIDAHKKQQLVTETQTLLDHSKRNHKVKSDKITRLKTDSVGGVKKLARVINALRKFEGEEFGSFPVNDNSTPYEVIQHLEKQMKGFEDDSEDSICRSIQKIKKVYKKKLIEEKIAECPCCSRKMNKAEAETFLNTIIGLDAKIVALDQEKSQQNRTTKRQYEKWKQIVNDSIQDCQEFNRLRKEVEDLEQIIEEENLVLSTLKTELEGVNMSQSALQTESTELHNFYGETGRLQDVATGVMDKENQIKSKEKRIELHTPNNGGRDLMHVETDVNRRMEEKESIIKNVTTLNKEMNDLNQKIRLASDIVSSSKRTLQEKESQFQKDQENAIRKKSLQEKILESRNEEEKVYNK